VKEDHRTQNKFWDLVEAFAVLRHKQRYTDADGWLHASVEDFNEAKTIFMKRKANHRTHLTNAQTKVVQSIIAMKKDHPYGVPRSKIAEDLGISPQAVSKILTAIDANTRFIVYDKGPFGEKLYRCTVSALEVVYGEGPIVTLPEGYTDPQPPFNHDATNHATTKTTHNNYKHTTTQPNIEIDSNGDSCGSKVDPKHCYARENGCDGCKASTDSETIGCDEVAGDGCATTTVSAKFNVDYRTDINGELRQFHEGEAWAKRGVVIIQAEAST
jgi:hypothetical protein